VDFDLNLLAPAFAARAADWENLGVVCGAPSEPSATVKPASQIVLESYGHLADFVLWTSGEAEGTVIRLSDGRRMVKVYQLHTAADLDSAVDDLVWFVRSDRVPAGGHLWDS
jgi:hypothetical protein